MKATVVFDMHHTLYRVATQGEVVTAHYLTEQIEAMPFAIETFLSFYRQGYKIVIISTSDAQSSRSRLNDLLIAYGLSENEIRELLKNIDILSMQFFGSKHTKEAWIEAMKPYKNIEYIFEDGEAKLHAAGEAAKELGSDPELYSSVEEFVR
ncbi:MAG TPA: hypothetical protein DDX29_11255 [Clostridiales bacterium]|nr:hypothetical protein [Clostridiales bacterium]